MRSVDKRSVNPIFSWDKFDFEIKRQKSIYPMGQSTMHFFIALICI